MSKIDELGMRKVFVGMIEFGFESGVMDEVLDHWNSDREHREEWLNMWYLGEKWASVSVAQKLLALRAVYNQRETIDLDKSSTIVQAAALFLLTDFQVAVIPKGGMVMSWFWDLEPADNKFEVEFEDVVDHLNKREGIVA